MLELDKTVSLNPTTKKILTGVTETVNALYRELFPPLPTKVSAWSVLSDLTKVVSQQKNPIANFYEKHAMLIEQLRQNPPHRGLIALFRDKEGLSLIEHLFQHERMEEIQELIKYHEPALGLLLAYISHKHIASNPITTLSHDDGFGLLDMKQVKLLKSELSSTQQKAILTLINEANPEQLGTKALGFLPISHAFKGFNANNLNETGYFRQNILTQLIQSYLKQRQIPALNKSLNNDFSDSISDYIEQSKAVKTAILTSLKSICQETESNTSKLAEQFTTYWFGAIKDTRLHQHHAHTHPWIQWLEQSDPNLMGILLSSGIKLSAQLQTIIEEKLLTPTPFTQAHESCADVASELSGASAQQASVSLSDKDISGFFYLLHDVMNPTTEDRHRESIIKLSKHPAIRNDLLLPLIINTRSHDMVVNPDTGFVRWINQKHLASTYETLKIIKQSIESENQDFLSAIQEVMSYFTQGLSTFDTQQAQLEAEIRQAMGM